MLVAPETESQIDAYLTVQFGMSRKSATAPFVAIAEMEPLAAAEKEIVLRPYELPLISVLAAVSVGF